jgi:dihydrolipoamide dehydrogenase
MLVPQMLQDGFVTATNALRGSTLPLEDQVSPIGSFTDPEYAQVGLTEAKARAAHDVVTAVVHFGSTSRMVIDGRTFGFCKLIVDRKTCRILGCHVVGERAVDITQVAAIAWPRGCAWTPWLRFRSRFLPTRGFSLSWRRSRHASSTLPGVGEHIR